MKMLLTSDWHLDAVTAGVPRRPEFENYLADLIAYVTDNDVDVIAVLGDYFDPGKMNGPELTARLLMYAQKLSTAGARRILWIAGNHDVVETSGGFTTISALSTAIAGGFCSGHATEWKGNTKIDRDHARHTVWEVPRVEDFGSYAVLGLPYQARSAYQPALLDMALDEAKVMSAEGIPVIVLGHMTVPGAVVGSESHEMARGRDVDIPLASLAEIKPVLVANGHYHKAQTVKGPGGIHVVIPGSPARFTFGERHDTDKGFVVLDLPMIGSAYA